MFRVLLFCKKEGGGPPFFSLIKWLADTLLKTSFQSRSLKNAFFPPLININHEGNRLGKFLNDFWN